VIKLNRIENYILKLEAWKKVCKEIIQHSEDIETKFVAEELQSKIKNDLVYFKHELEKLNR